MQQGIDCIIPAAGLSSRMNEWKPLISYRGSTVIENSVGRALEVCSRIILVTGYRGDELEELFSNWRDVHPVRNEEYHRGMFSSIQTGAGVLEAPLFFITLADMPEVPAKLYRLLLDKMHTHDTGTFGDFEGSSKAGPPPEMVRPICTKKPGHPVLCRVPVSASILAEPPESNMQNVMKHHRILEIEVNLPECLYDIDTPEDLEYHEDVERPGE